MYSGTITTNLDDSWERPVLVPRAQGVDGAGKGYALEQAWLKIVQGVVNYDEGKERKKKKGKK